jgi:hypothetical protein
MLHLLGFYHEPSNEAAMELEEEEQLILKNRRWKGKGLAKGAQDSSKPQNIFIGWNVLLIFFVAVLLVTSLRARLVQLHEQLHEQLHNFNSQTANSLPNSLVSFSENSLSQG